MRFATQDNRGRPQREASAAGRKTLARWIMGDWHAGETGTLDEAAFDGRLAQAWSEGVTVLVSDRLAGLPELPVALRLACRDWVRGQAAAELGRRVRLRAVLDRLAQARIPVLVLKGAALAHWLYPAPYLREHSDVDLLFGGREDARRAAAVLGALGYSVPHAPGRFHHELACRAADGALELDMHWALSDWPALDRLPGFAELHAASIGLPGLGGDARGLDAAHALMHAAVHRASNLAVGLGDRLKWLYDLCLLARALDRGDGWPRFVEASRRARVCGIAAEGLAAAADVFATAVPDGVWRELDEARAEEPLDAGRLSDWRYIQRRNLAALQGWRNRLAWVVDRALPSAGHLRALYGEGHSYPTLLWRRLFRAGSRFSGRT